jgi:hypothetical protein
MPDVVEQHVNPFTHDNMEFQYLERGRLLQVREALDGAINWYRAFPLAPSLSLATPSVSTPTMYIWSSGDSVVSRVGADQKRAIRDRSLQLPDPGKCIPLDTRRSAAGTSGPHRIARSPAHTSASEAVTAPSHQPEGLGHVGQPVDTLESRVFDSDETLRYLTAGRITSERRVIGSWGTT